MIATLWRTDFSCAESRTRRPAHYLVPFAAVSISFAMLAACEM